MPLSSISLLLSVQALLTISMLSQMMRVSILNESLYSLAKRKGRVNGEINPNGSMRMPDHR